MAVPHLVCCRGCWTSDIPVVVAAIAGPKSRWKLEKPLPAVDACLCPEERLCSKRGSFQSMSSGATTAKPEFTRSAVRWGRGFGCSRGGAEAGQVNECFRNGFVAAHTEAS